MSAADDFELTFPLFVVLVPSLKEKRYGLLGGKLPSDESAFTLFTEELFAERARDANCPGGIVCKFSNATELEPHLTLYESWGAKYATIDASATEAKRIPCFAIESVRRIIRRSK